MAWLGGPLEAWLIWSLRLLFLSPLPLTHLLDYDRFVSASALRLWGYPTGVFCCCGRVDLIAMTSRLLADSVHLLFRMLPPRPVYLKENVSDYFAYRESGGLRFGSRRWRYATVFVSHCRDDSNRLSQGLLKLAPRSSLAPGRSLS